MRSPGPFPAALSGRVFTHQQASELGVSPGRLRSRDVRNLQRGLYAHAMDDPPDLAVVAGLDLLHPRLWASHRTAAKIHDFWLPYDSSRPRSLAVSCQAGRVRPQLAGIEVHQTLTMASEIQYAPPASGLPSGSMALVTTPARTWLDLAAELTIPDLVAVGDQIVRNPRPRFEGRSRPWATREELAGLLSAHPNLQGIRRARTALEQIRVGSDSPAETRLRLALVRVGLPEPDLQVALDPADPYSPTADVGYRRYRIALQYDGGGHRSYERLSADNARDNAFTSAGWAYYKFDRLDWRTDFVRAANVVQQALLAAGRCGRRMNDAP
ncbi:hypothetical protein BJH93_09485 [Kocuria polaris]|nr:hypothetical protein [Kocuria polaris]